MILVDTSVWIDHLHHTDAALVALLEQNAVWMHPMILGELACGNLKNRASLIGLWQALPRLSAATDMEARQFLEIHELLGQGIGFIDVHLLCVVALANGAQLWARDQRLAEIATGLGLEYPET
jgi:predicted nucleic acid-binding protein